jgi:hypothetical protein
VVFLTPLHPKNRLIKEEVRSLEMLSGSRYIMNAAQNSSDS